MVLAYLLCLARWDVIDDRYYLVHTPIVTIRTQQQSTISTFVRVLAAKVGGQVVVCRSVLLLLVAWVACFGCLSGVVDEGTGNHPRLVL
jgi:hypothetical protein